MADAASNLALLDLAIEACLTAIAAGAAVVEYEIGGRRLRRTDPSAVLRELTRSRSTLAPIANRASRRATTLGSFDRG